MAEDKTVDIEGARAATKLYGLGVVEEAMRGKTKAMAEDQMADPSSSPQDVVSAQEVFGKVSGNYLVDPQDPIVSAFLSVPADDPEAGRNFFKAFKAYLPFGDSPDEEGDNVGISGVAITNESQIDYTPRSQSGGMCSSMADVNKSMLPRGPTTTIAGNVARSLGVLPKAGPDSVGARR